VGYLNPTENGLVVPFILILIRSEHAGGGFNFDNEMPETILQIGGELNFHFSELICRNIELDRLVVEQLTRNLGRGIPALPGAKVFCEGVPVGRLNGVDLHRQLL